MELQKKKTEKNEYSHIIKQTCNKLSHSAEPAKAEQRSKLNEPRQCHIRPVCLYLALIKFVDCFVCFCWCKVYQHTTSHLAPTLYLEVRIRWRKTVVWKHVDIELDCLSVGMNMNVVLLFTRECRLTQSPLKTGHGKQEVQWSYSNPKPETHGSND